VTRNISIIGDGTWGTTLAMLLSEKGHSVSLWSVFPDYLDEMKRTRINRKFLPDHKIPENIELTVDLGEALGGKDLIVLAVPSQYFRSVCEKIKEAGAPDVPYLSLAKGIENETLMRMSEVAEEVLGNRKIVVLSGPNIATEIVEKKPSATTVSCSDISMAEAVREMLMTPYFRVYTHHDTIGVELGGALKNPIAIAAGIVDGFGMGTNTKSALLTRGLVEITRLGVAMGAERETFFGLSGLGDLATTCFSPASRNHWFGTLIAKGKATEEIVSSTEMVVEGVNTSKSAHELYLRHKIEMPIIKQVYNVVWQGKSPKKAILELMTREPKRESSR
jgi:glycerol-3-phosphate dehydrogenase (NAD(P)+)